MYQKNTEIAITIRGDGIELFDYNLPLPHEYTRNPLNPDVYTIYYNIKGYFHTSKAFSYLNDVLARFMLSMRVLHTEVARTDKQGIELSSFGNLKSIVREQRTYAHLSNCQDDVFWAIKLHTEALIKEFGEQEVPYSVLEDFAFNNFVGSVKDKSTLKAKCRSIHNWYNARGWTIPERKKRLTQGELKMSRQEGARKARQKLIAQTKTKVISLVTGLYAHEYVTNTGKWNISKIAKDSNTNRRTASKYAQEIEPPKK